MAEFVFRDMVKKAGREVEFTVASSATSTEEIWGDVGNPIYPPAKAKLREKNIPFEERYATLLTRSDYGKYDLFLCMDSRNLSGIRRIFGDDPEGKVRLLMSFTEEGGEVSDPWYSRDFEAAYSDIEKGCRALLESL